MRWVPVGVAGAACLGTVLGAQGAPGTVLVAGAGMALLLAVFLRRAHPRLALVCVAVGGVAATALQARVALTPVGPSGRRDGLLEACVRDVERLTDGERWRLDAGGAPLSVRVLAWTAVEPGDVVRGRATLIRAADAPADRRVWYGVLRPGAWHVRVRGGCRGPGATLARARVRFVRRAWSTLTPREAAVATALATGSRAAVPGATLAAFQQTGTVHVLVVSGLHLAIVMALVLGVGLALLRRVPAVAARIDVRMPATAVAIAVATLYFAYVGGGVPVQRAWIACLVAALLLWRSARRDPWSVLAVALTLIVLASPAALFGPSLQLSFTAVVGILVLGNGRRARATGLHRVWAAVLSGVRATLGASVTTAPIIVWYFGRLPLVGLVANGVALPGLAGVGVPVLVSAAWIDPVWPAMSTWILRGVSPLLALTSACIEAAARLPGASVTATRTDAWWLAAVAFAVAATRTRERTLLAVCVVAALGSGAGGTVDAIRHRTDGGLRVSFLDVGHGDAALLRLPDGRVVVVDGGGRARRPHEDPRRAQRVGRAVVVPALRAWRVRRVDVLVLTHAHPDHLEGLSAVAEAFPVRELWFAGPRPPDAAFRTLVARVEASGGRLRFVGAGYRETWPGGGLEVLYPTADPGPETRRDVRNDRSLVMRAWQGRRSVLFTGDIEAAGEAALLHAGPIGSDLVKVPHHGSATSSSPAFLRAAQARHAIFSVGPSGLWRLPDDAVVARWRASGAAVWRTDCHGTVTFATRGERWEVRTQRTPAGPPSGDFERDCGNLVGR